VGVTWGYNGGRWSRRSCPILTPQPDLLVVVAEGRNDGGGNIDEATYIDALSRGNELGWPTAPLRAEVSTDAETVHRRMLVKPGITGPVAGERPVRFALGRGKTQ
jgi:hypothetical protein